MLIATEYCLQMEQIRGKNRERESTNNDLCICPEGHLYKVVSGLPVQVFSSSYDPEPLA